MVPYAVSLVFSEAELGDVKMELVVCACGQLGQGTKMGLREEQAGRLAVFKWRK